MADDGFVQVHFLAAPGFVSHLRRVAEDIGLTAPQLIIGERVIADERPVLASLIQNLDEASVA